jgi:hypothetical protein
MQLPDFKTTHEAFRDGLLDMAISRRTDEPTAFIIPVG